MYKYIYICYMGSTCSFGCRHMEFILLYEFEPEKMCHFQVITEIPSILAATFLGSTGGFLNILGAQSHWFHLGLPTLDDTIGSPISWTPWKSRYSTWQYMHMNFSHLTDLTHWSFKNQWDQFSSFDWCILTQLPQVMWGNTVSMRQIASIGSRFGCLNQTIVFWKPLKFGKSPRVSGCFNKTCSKFESFWINPFKLANSQLAEVCFCNLCYTPWWWFSHCWCWSKAQLYPWFPHQNMDLHLHKSCINNMWSIVTWLFWITL